MKTRVKVSREELIKQLPFKELPWGILNFLPETIELEGEVVENPKQEKCEHEWVYCWKDNSGQHKTYQCCRCNRYKEEKQPRLLAPALYRLKDDFGYRFIKDLLFSSKEEAAKACVNDSIIEIIWPARLDPVTGMYEVPND